VTLAENVLVLPNALQDASVIARDQVFAGGRDNQPFHLLDRQAGVRFGERIQLIGYSLNADRVSAGQDVVVTLYWAMSDGEPIETDYRVFVHLVDSSGQIIAQHDGEPVGGHRPTSTWRNGLVVDAHRPVWQREAFTGEATILVGLYDGRTQERLPAGDRYPHDAVPLGQIQIQ
jgi:hypothetical protein